MKVFHELATEEVYVHIIAVSASDLNLVGASDESHKLMGNLRLNFFIDAISPWRPDAAYLLLLLLLLLLFGWNWFAYYLLFEVWSRTCFGFGCSIPSSLCLLILMLTFALWQVSKICLDPFMFLTSDYLI